MGVRFAAIRKADLLAKVTQAGALAGVLALAACATPVPPNSTFLVFFPVKSSTLTPEANAALDRAAATIKSTGPLTVAIAAGGGESLQLAQPRFAAVSDGLRKRGVSSGLIARASLPQSDVKAGPTGYDRVEVILEFQK